MRIEVGYGLEPTLTDAVSSSILRDVVAPRFREGKVAEGIGAGLDAIEAAIKGTYRAPAARRAPASGSLSFAQLLLLLVVLGGIGVAVVPSLFFDRGARRNGWTGHGTGWGGPFMGGGGFGGGGGGREAAAADSAAAAAASAAAAQAEAGRALARIAPDGSVRSGRAPWPPKAHTVTTRRTRGWPGRREGSSCEAAPEGRARGVLPVR